MSESGSFLPHEVEGVVTPNDENSRLIRGFIELMVNDNTSLSLETTDKEELKRLNMRFIGWPHSITYTPALFEQIKEYDPHVLVLESVGDDANFISTRELIRNLLMFGIPTQVGLNGEYVEAFIRDVPEHEDDQIMRLVRDNRLHPILRKMDISSDQMAAMAFNGDYPSTFAKYSLDWDFGQLESTKSAMRSALMGDGLIDRTRESVMIGDVSRIAANALAKMKGDVRVMACFGMTHTAVARYFQKNGISADLRFINRETGQVSKTTDFSRHHAVVREANLKNRISENILNEYVLEMFLDMRAALVRHANGDKRSFSEVRATDNLAIEGLIKNYGQRLLKEWSKVDSRRLATAGMKEKARQKFQESVEQLVARAIEENL